MNGLQAVDCLAVYLHKNQDVQVFKYEKTMGFQGEYIVVNHLPFTFGQLVNSNNVLNVNVHVPALSKGRANVMRMTEIYDNISQLIPNDVNTGSEYGLNLSGSYFSISSVSQPMPDKDNTYFLNIKVKTIINQLKM